jgi:uncharacterized protein (TIGR03437 family)
MRMRYFCALTACVAAWGQPPSKPVIDIRGVTNFFSGLPAPATVGAGSIVQITGLNLGPSDGATAPGAPWPTQLGDVQVMIDGRPAPLYSVSPSTIIAQVPPNAAAGLDTVVVKRASGTSAQARVNIAAVVPAIQTVKDTGFGAPKGTVASGVISFTADGLGPTTPRIAAGDAGPSDTPAVPNAALLAYVGGLRAKVTATASTKTPGAFDVQVAVPAGARAGDLITLLAARQSANPVVYNPATAARTEFVALPSDAPDVVTLTPAGVNGDYLVANAARDSSGCYAGAVVDLAAKTYTALSDCLTSTGAAVLPVVMAPESDSAAALIGPPQGDAQSGISATAAVYNAAGAPAAVTLASPASTLAGTSTEFTAVMPGTPPKLATIDPITDAVQVANAPGAGGGGSGAPIAVNGLTDIYTTAALGQGRTAVIAGDDPAKPTTAQFAILDSSGAVVSSQPFPAGWLPLLNAAVPPRAGQTPSTAALHEPSVLDTASRLFYVLARATDSSKDAFIAFGLAGEDPQVAAAPAGWFASSCTSDMRLFSIELSHQAVIAGSQVAETAYKNNCSGSGFLVLDFGTPAVSAVALPALGVMRVPATKADTSLASMSDYIFAARLDPTRAGVSDTIYVLDGANGNISSLSVAAPVKGFTDASVLQVPALVGLFAQNINKTAGDDGFSLFDLDAQTVTNIPVPDGYDTLAPLNDGATVCCLATRKLVLRALKQGGSAVAIYDLAAGTTTVVEGPQGVTSIGPATAAAGANGRLVAANARANTVYAVAYRGAKQAGIIVIHVP